MGWWSRWDLPERAAAGAERASGNGLTVVSSDRQVVEAPVSCSKDRRFKPPAKHSFSAWVCHEEGSGISRWVQKCRALGVAWRMLGALAAMEGRAAGAVAATWTLGSCWKSCCPGTITLRRHRSSARAGQAVSAPL